MSDREHLFTETEMSIRSVEVSLIVAKNISAARNALNISQDDLAERALISRATLIQIESGRADPLLSTIVKLASALEISPTILLMGKNEIEAIAQVSKSNECRTTLAELDEEKVQEMERLVESGMDRNRNKAAKMGGEMSGAISSAAGAIPGAAIGTILLPGLGTVIGATLGALFGKTLSKRR